MASSLALCPPTHTHTHTCHRPPQAAFAHWNVSLITISFNFPGNSQDGHTVHSASVQCHHTISRYAAQLINNHLNSVHDLPTVCTFHSFTSATALPAQCIIMSLNSDCSVPGCLSHLLIVCICCVCVCVCVCACVCVQLLLCVLRGRGDVLPLWMEGLRHHPLLFLHRHHPPCGGTGVSPGCKCTVIVASDSHKGPSIPPECGLRLQWAHNQMRVTLCFIRPYFPRRIPCTHCKVNLHSLSI